MTHRPDFYEAELPTPDDVALLVEVADASLRYDRHIKGPLYAEAGIRDFSIVDVGGQAVEVYREPVTRRFRRTERIARGGALTPLAFSDATLAVSDILG